AVAFPGAVEPLTVLSHEALGLAQRTAERDGGDGDAVAAEAQPVATGARAAFVDDFVGWRRTRRWGCHEGLIPGGGKPVRRAQGRHRPYRFETDFLLSDAAQTGTNFQLALPSESRFNQAKLGGA